VPRRSGNCEQGAELAIIHAGDWLPKLLIITTIVMLWR